MVDLPKRMDREKAHRMLTAVKTIYDAAGIPFYLAFGTFLGAIREHDFIEHDGDIDIFVMGKDIDKSKSVDKEFKAFSLSCAGCGASLQSSGKRLQAQVTGPKEVYGTLKLDVYSLILFRGVYWYVRLVNRNRTSDGCPMLPNDLGRTCEYALPFHAKYFRTPEYAMLHGERYLVPCRPVELLNSMWGNADQWKTPSRGQFGYQMLGVWFRQGEIQDEHNPVIGK